MSSPEVPSGGHGPSSMSVLTKKIGPLPGYAYVLIAVGAVIAYRYWKSRTAAPVPVLSSDPSASGAADTNTGSGGSGGSSGSVTTLPAGSPSPSTNGDWSRMAAQGLIAQGLDPGAVSNALFKFTSGNGSHLTAQEDAIVMQALTKYGQPPEGVLPLITDPVPSGVPAPSPAGHAVVHKYEIQPGDSWLTVSEHFFGNPNEGWRLKAANPHVAFQRGNTISVPVPLSANQYAITPGDSWESVSMKFYGTTSHVPALKAANPGVTFQRGQTLRIP